MKDFLNGRFLIFPAVLLCFLIFVPNAFAMDYISQTAYNNWQLNYGPIDANSKKACQSFMATGFNRITSVSLRLAKSDNYAGSKQVFLKIYKPGGYPDLTTSPWGWCDAYPAEVASAAFPMSSLSPISGGGAVKMIPIDANLDEGKIYMACLWPEYVYPDYVEWAYQDSGDVYNGGARWDIKWGCSSGQVLWSREGYQDHYLVVSGFGNEILNPADNSQFFVGGSINFSGHCAVNGTNNYQLKEGSNTLTTFSCASNSWSSSLSLPIGSHVINLVSGGQTKAMVNFTVLSHPPANPVSGQYGSAGGSNPIYESGTAPARDVNFQSLVFDPDGDQVKFQIELRPINQLFVGIFTHQTDFVPSGSIVSVSVSDLSKGDYHWQYRAVDSYGAVSAWTEFGTDQTKPDFVINPPPEASNAYQYKESDNADHIPDGGISFTGSVNFRAWVSDPDADHVRLHVELRPLSELFAGAYTQQTDLLPSGSVASLTISDLEEGDYHWQYRAVDQYGRPSGEWQEFGTDPAKADFRVSLKPTYKVAVILAEPSDISFDLSHNKAYFEGIADQVRDYYCENAFGKWDAATHTCRNSLFNLEFEVFDNGGQNYTLSQNKLYYGQDFKDMPLPLPSDVVHNPNGTYAYTVGVDGNGNMLTLADDDRTEKFVWDTINQADADIDYNDYYGVLVVHVGGSSQETKNSDDLFTQYWTLDLSPAPLDTSGEHINNWMSVSESDGKYAWSHEFGHALGKIMTGSILCDLYSSDISSCHYGGSVVDYLDPMGERTKWRETKDIISYFSSFSRIKLGWLGENVVGFGNYDLESLDTMKYGDKVFRYNLPDGSHYLMEARTDDPVYGKWDTYLPGNPVVIYKVSPKEVTVNGQLRTIDFVNIAGAVGATIPKNPNRYPSSNILDIPYKDSGNGLMIAVNDRQYEPDSFQINTQISEYSPANYIGAILRPKLSLLGRIWQFVSKPLREGDPNVIRGVLVDHPGEKECLRFFGIKIGNICEVPGPFGKSSPFSTIMITWPDFLLFRLTFPLLLASLFLHTLIRSFKGKNEKLSVVLKVMIQIFLWIGLLLFMLYILSFSFSFTAEAAQTGFNDDITSPISSSNPSGAVLRPGLSLLGKVLQFSPTPFKEGSGKIIQSTLFGPGPIKYLHVFGVRIDSVQECPGCSPRWRPLFMYYWPDFRRLRLILLALFLFAASLLHFLARRAKGGKAARALKACFWIAAVLMVLCALSFSLSVSEAAAKIGSASIPSAVGPSGSNPSLDIDLHAYDDQGNHTGMNYETWEYENNIPGAEASGDLTYDDEWIFVPAGAHVRYEVSSRDIGQYLAENPGLAGQLPDTHEDYDLRAVSYDAAGQRYESAAVSEQIAPDAANGHMVSGENGNISITPADQTPPATSPSITGTPGQNGWLTSDAQIFLSAQDNADGVGVEKTEYSLDNGQIWYTYSAPFTISAEGINYILYRSTDFAGNIEEVKALEIRIDKTAPTVNYTQLQAEYLLNSALIIFNYSAADGLSGVSSVSATMDSQPLLDGAQINFFSLGPHMIIIDAIDNAGNSTSKTIQFRVVYSFSGFLPPVKSDSTGLYKQGRILPVKFQLTDASNINISTAIAHLYVAKVQDGLVGTDEIPLSASSADSGNLFRYSGGQYIYNFSTDTLSIGTWQLKVVLDDGREYAVLISIK